MVKIKQTKLENFKFVEEIISLKEVTPKKDTKRH